LNKKRGRPPGSKNINKKDSKILINKQTYYGFPIAIFYKKHTQIKVSIKLYENTNIDWLLCSEEIPKIETNSQIINIIIGENLINKFN
jgi:hypothetical protein